MSYLIPEDDEARFLPEVRVDVLERAARSLGVEKVGEGDERAVQHDPDDIEFPAEGFDADGGDFDNHAVDQSQHHMWRPFGGGLYKLKIQFVAVPGVRRSATLPRSWRVVVCRAYLTQHPSASSPAR